jgi:periplasmic protein TonB
MQAPAYPTEAKAMRERGTVILRLTVGVDGTPGAIEVSRSSGHRRLDKAAADEVARWTFNPAIKDGRPVAETISVPVQFALDENIETISAPSDALDTIIQREG